MSSLFGTLSNDGLEQSQDRLGGYQPLNTDIYTGTIKAAYAGKSDGGAQSVSLVVSVPGQEYRETVYVTNKLGENFFINQHDKNKKVPLPGFTTIDDVCLIVTGKPLAEQDTEEKVIKLYDKDAQAELPKAVQMLVELLDKPISLAILKQLENKSVKDTAGVYQPTAETMEKNVIEKVFHPEMKITVAEARAGKDKAEFWPAWEERNKGKTRDKRKLKEGEAGAPGRPSKPMGAAAAPAAAPARKSLFGK